MRKREAVPEGTAVKIIFSLVLVDKEWYSSVLEHHRYPVEYRQ